MNIGIARGFIAMPTGRSAPIARASDISPATESSILRAQSFLPRGDCSHSEFVSVFAREHLSKIIIRAQDKEALLRLGKIFGCVLPRNNKVVLPKSKGYEDCELLWLGPDELLLRSRSGEDSRVAYSRVELLERGLKGLHFSVTNVSDYYVVARVSGARARVILQKNCPLDFHPSIFRTDDCAQSIYGKGSVLFSCASADSFDLQIRISLSGYLWSLLELSTRSEQD